MGCLCCATGLPVCGLRQLRVDVMPTMRPAVEACQGALVGTLYTWSALMITVLYCRAWQDMGA